ncbi:MAG: ABC transporter ATP-binding protein [Desulfobacterales bacterium]|jgi:multiple sugar transport system ATP-binding protein
MAHIEAKGLVKHYGSVKAVLGIDFEVADGEFVAILGPSGCGKSSTMRMIAGLEEITDGTISFNGKPVNDVRARDRNVAMSFENYALYAPLTIYENIAFPLRSAGKNDSQVDQRVREIAKKMELTDMLHIKPGGLSSGQAQRVGLARALVREPSVFLLDEPISHLDTRQRYRMRRFIKSLHQEFGYTMIYVTHDQEEALALADRVMVMSDGEIQQMDIPEVIYMRPKNMFVAGFVGEPPINFLPFKSLGQRKIIIQDNEISVPDELATALENIGPEGIAAIRPHFMSLGSQSPIVLQGTAFITEELQDHNEIFIDIGNLKISLIAPPHQRPDRGETVTVSIDPKQLLLFPNHEKSH